MQWVFFKRYLEVTKSNSWLLCDDLLFGSGECLVCSLKLCEQISTSNQGLLMFECGK